MQSIWQRTPGSHLPRRRWPYNQHGSKDRIEHDPSGFDWPDAGHEFDDGRNETGSCEAAKAMMGYAGPCHGLNAPAVSNASCVACSWALQATGASRLRRCLVLWLAKRRVFRPSCVKFFGAAFRIGRSIKGSIRAECTIELHFHEQPR